MFIIVQKGIYRHNVVGCSMFVCKALEMADTAIRREKDDHHEFQVLSVAEDELVEDAALVCTLSRSDRDGMSWVGIKKAEPEKSAQEELRESAYAFSQMLTKPENRGHVFGIFRKPGEADQDYDARIAEKIGSVPDHSDPDNYLNALLSKGDAHEAD